MKEALPSLSCQACPIYPIFSFSRPQLEGMHISMGREPESQIWISPENHGEISFSCSACVSVVPAADIEPHAS